MFSEPSWNCSRMKRCRWSAVTGSMPPDPPDTELCSCPLNHQVTECDLQRRTDRRIWTDIQALIRASLCTSSDTVWTRCAVTQAANATDHESSRRHVSIFLLHKTSSPRHSSRAADDQEHIEVHQRGGCCNSQSCWLHIEQKRLKKALDPSELIEAAAKNMIDMRKKA